MRFKFLSIVALLVMGFAGTGFSITGDQVLAKVEAIMSAPKDQHSVATMNLGKTDGSGKEVREMEIWTAGSEKRVIKFKKPSSVKGIGLLVTSESEMYIYLPAQKKTRRISSGSKNNDFQGTDFSYDEMGSYDYKSDYSSKITSEDDKAYILKLTRKSGSSKPYTTMIMVIDKANFMPKSTKMYDGSKLIKELTVLKVKKIGKYTIPTAIRIENKVKKHFTELLISDIQFDQGYVKAEKFTKRFLKKK